MDYRNIIASGFFLLCLAVLVQSLSSANAFPQGPTISLGTSPIAYYFRNCSNPGDIFTNTSTQDFIITDILVDNGGTRFIIDGTLLNPNLTQNVHMTTGFRIPSGSVVSCSPYTGSPYVTINGFYAQP